MFIQRYLGKLLPKKTSNQIVLITGARQTGKTTLAKYYYGDLNYLNCDAPEIRDRLRETSTFQWAQTVGPAIIDEVQKVPETFEKIKYAFDEGSLHFSVLSGSSQILLLKKIRETLAGRVALYQMYPLMISEIIAYETQNPLREPLIEQICTVQDINAFLLNLPTFLPTKLEGIFKTATENMIQWGGMPRLYEKKEAQKIKWLRDYESTYLERDLMDLARLDDLKPFRALQKMAALRCSQLLNYSELARDASIAVDTARRYLEYLRLSYQVILLPPYFRNLTSTLIKTPKIYWTDMGIVRTLTHRFGETHGDFFENFVISELTKWIQTSESPVEMYFYRTRTGLELDLILQLPSGILGIEIKNRSKIYSKDYQPMIQIMKKTNDWLGGFIVYTGDKIEKVSKPNIWAIPVWRLFGTSIN